MNRAFRAAITTGVRGKIMQNSVRTDYPYYHRANVTRPRNHIPFYEKVFWGVFMSLTIVSVPGWIMYHHREYGNQGGGGDE